MSVDGGSQPGLSPEVSVERTPRPGGSMGAGVALGVALGLMLPMALMSRNLGMYFGGGVDEGRLVLAELVIGLVVWLIVCVVLVVRGPRVGWG